MSTRDLERLRGDAESLMQAVSREYYLALAGFKAEAELQPLYEQHAAAVSDDALQLLREAFEDHGAAPAARRSVRMLLEWIAETRIARALAPLEEREIAWEASAIVRLPEGGTIPYQRVPIEIANAEDRGYRLALDDARARVVERELSPLRLERLQREHEMTLALGIAGTYNDTFEALSGVELAPLAEQCDAFLRDTQAMWEEVQPEFVRRALGIDPADATRADALTLLRAREFDGGFPAGGMQRAILGQVREMGIAPDANGRIRLDTEDREGKRSRAFCSPVRVPDEVYLVLRPFGGQTDYRTFLHELGHALHFAYVRPDLPFEHRWLGDNSITEGYAMLMDHLMRDAGWLRRYTQLAAGELEAFLRSSAFEELHFLRRYCAKLRYEIELHGEAAAPKELPAQYAEILGDATGFRYQEADAFVDVDPRFYAVRYLRAWQLQAVITETLIERYDEDWYRNPRAGPWIVNAMFSEGQGELADELAQRVTGRTLSFQPLIRAIERSLAPA